MAQLSRWISFWAALLALWNVAASRPAHALDFQCIEASRYRNLLRIFGEDPEALVNFFRVGRSFRPAPDTCRAMAVTGTLKDGDARKLLDEIVKSRGWLTTLYLVHAGSNRDEEVKVAGIIRTFWLRTRYVGRTGALYQPDFLGRDPEPVPSRTTAWPPVPQTKATTQPGQEDYLRTVDRKLPDPLGKADCLESCASFFLAGMDRVAESPSANSVKPLVQPPGDAAMRLRAALQLWLEDTRVDRAAAVLPVPATIASAKRLPRAAAQPLRADCSLEIDANTGAQDQVQSTIEGLAAKNFNALVRVDQLLPRFDAVHTTVARLGACLAGSYDRRRLNVLRQQCGPKCDLVAMEATATKRAEELMKQWEPEVAAAPETPKPQPTNTELSKPELSKPEVSKPETPNPNAPRQFVPAPLLAPSTSSPAIDGAPK